MTNAQLYRTDHAQAPLAQGGVARAAALISHARRSISTDPERIHRYLDELAAILVVAGPAQAPSTPARGGLTGWQLRRVTDFIEQNLAETLVTEDLAAVAGISTGHFSRAFKISVGETPHGYIIRQRVRRAQQLMLETRDTLAHIAFACGLTDQAHLTRLFRRSVGMTPLCWRRTWQGAANAMPNHQICAG